MMKTVDGALTDGLLSKYEARFRSNPANRVALNAVSRTAIPEVAMNREVLARTDFTFSDMVKTGDATSQMASGRCWMFAGLNTMRIRAMKKMNLANFELSQSYTFFWDKLEKSNYFMENIIENIGEDIQSRIVMWLLAGPLGDGGQWDMFANLIRRYGAVPKSVMPETFNSSNSGHVNYLVTLKLREDAMILREMHRKGARASQLRTRKEEMMSEIYKLLVIYFGEPPKQFLWQYRDKKAKFHREPKPMTPQAFYKKYVNIELDGMVSLINCPTKDKPYNKMYTVQCLGNVVGGQIVRYLNIDIKTLKQAAVDTIRRGEPVWFGCDVGKGLFRDGGIMHTRMFEYDKLLGTEFGMNKAQRVDYGDSLMTHAMVLLGVNLVNNPDATVPAQAGLRLRKPTKWKVENSWSDKVGEKGFFVMTDEWFDEYLYQVVVPIKSLPSKYRQILKQKPVVLKPWDPMGSLAVMH
ncbi:MAG: C1 family peptidase [Planctomycetes bacterium]|nr:C1 family peptidase [Planctomycetota bacterium]